MTIRVFYLYFIYKSIKIMFKLILGIEIFIFILSCLNVLKNAFNLIKVVWTKNGKVLNNTIDKVLLSFSISYIITQLIIGF